MGKGFCFQLIRKRLFGRQQTLPVEVAVHQSYGRLVPVQRNNKGGDRFQPCLCRRVCPPVPGDQFVVRLAALHPPHQQRGQNALLPDALRQGLHFFVVLHLVGVLWEAVQPPQRDLDHFLLRHFFKSHLSSPLQQNRLYKSYEFVQIPGRPQPACAAAPAHPAHGLCWRFSAALPPCNPLV